MNEHHFRYKLVAKGLPPEMMEMAKEKSATNPSQAYDLICKGERLEIVRVILAPM